MTKPAFDEATIAALEKLKDGPAPRTMPAAPPLRAPVASPGVAWETSRNLQAVCIKLFEDHKQSVPNAVAALIARAKEDEALRADLLNGALEERALAAMRHVSAFIGRKHHELRKYDGNGSAGVPKPGAGRSSISRERLAAWADEIKAGLLETFQLPDGTYLKDADRDGLLSAASFYREEATELRAQARWLELIAQGLPPGERVGARMTNDRVGELQSIARDEELGDEKE